MEQIPKSEHMKCAKCSMDVEVPRPPMPPQIVNGQAVSTVVMLNVLAKCHGCGTEYLTQINHVNLGIGWMEYHRPDEKRIVIPSIVPPKI